MAERLYDPSNDEDYLNILTNNATIQVKKEASKIAGAADVKVGETRSGKVKDQIKIGQGLDVVGTSEKGIKTSAVEGLHVNDALAQIHLATQNAIYKIDVIDPGRQGRKMSLLYLRRGYLDFGDKMPDGFYDSGRHTKFRKEGDHFVPEGERELLVLDQDQDIGLKKILEKAEKLLGGITDLPTKIKMLALYVSNVMGGSQLVRPGKGADIVSLMEAEVSDIQSQSGNAQKIVPIGYLTHGVCRHRALLFKYLSDRLGIPSRLVRGDYGGPGGGHAWNVVKLEDKILGGDNYFIVDVMHDPTQMYAEGSDKAKKYQRKNLRGVRAGFGGRSVVGRVG